MQGASNPATPPGPPKGPTALIVRCLADVQGGTDPADIRRGVAALLDRPIESAFVTEFTAAAEAQSVRLDLLWLAEARIATGPRPPMAALAIPGAGNTAMLFVTGGEMPIMGQSDGCGRISVGTEPSWLIEHRADVMLAAAMDIRDNKIEACRGVKMLQALVDPAQTAVALSYIQAGFTKLARLGYYRREVPRKKGSAINWPPGVRIVSLDRLADGEAQLARALETSYIDTQDCPALCGLREAADVLESHKSVGMYDPALWWVVFTGDAPVGCILLSVCDDIGSVELVYLGLGPQARGKGLGRGLLQHGLNELAERNARTLACAVDMANDPALKLYEGQGFKRFASRDAFILPLSKPH